MKKTLPASSAILLLTSLYAATAAAELHSAKGCMQEGTYKSMDGNKDGQLSKSEFMKFQEQRFDKIKQKNGMVSMEAYDKETNENNNSMNQKAIGTTSDNPNVNDRDAVNGRKY